MKIGDKEIGTGRIYIIADVGSNFNGSMELAKEYIYAAKEIGLDAIKFQSYKAETLFHPFKPDGTRWDAYDVVKRYELPLEWHHELFVCAERQGVEFITTPFSIEIIEELHQMGVRAFKIASGDLTFHPLLERIGKSKRPVILSTGMAYIEEIQKSLEILKENGVDEIALLHCVSNYPPHYRQINLRAIATLLKTFNVPVGLSDHTPDETTAIAAVAMGASIIEKHITMDKRMGTPDAAFAMTVPQFKEMIRHIRELEEALGDGQKRPAEDELEERRWARRGIYLKRAKGVGEAIRIDDVRFVRPVSGLGAEAWSEIEGKRLKVSLREGEAIRREHIE